MSKLISIKVFLITFLAAGNAFADYGGMMGGPGMMWGGGHMGGWVLLWGLYSLLCVVGIVIFFWLMFRMTWALETIAKAKGEGKP